MTVETIILAVVGFALGWMLWDRVKRCWRRWRLARGHTVTIKRGKDRR